VLALLEGIDRIRRAIDERPNDAVLWRRLGNLYNMLNDTSAAEESWSRALEIDKTEFPSALGLAQLSASLGDGEHFTPRLIEALARIRGLPASASPTGDSAEEMADVLLELLHKGDPEVVCHCGPTGELRLKQLEIAAFVTMTLPRQWDDPDREPDDPPDAQLAEFFGRVKASLFAWMQALDHLRPKQ
jgi:tetratricopeptide (TPR) repeat protein